MIWSPDHHLWLPEESRFGDSLGRARRWRNSLAMNAQNELTYGTGGHLQYSGTQGGHLMYGCDAAGTSCLYCTGGANAQLQVVISGVTGCVGCQHGTGISNYASLSGSLNGTYVLSRPDVDDEPCFYELDNIGAVADLYNNSGCTTGHAVNPFNISVSYGDNTAIYPLGLDVGKGIVYIVASTGSIWYGFYGEFTGGDCDGPIVVSNLLTTCGVDPGFPDTLGTGGTATITGV